MVTKNITSLTISMTMIVVITMKMTMNYTLYQSHYLVVLHVWIIVVAKRAQVGTNTLKPNLPPTNEMKTVIHH